MAIRNLSAKKLSEEIDVSRITIIHWREGRRLPSMTNLDELVRFFRISADSLMYFDIEKEMESFKNEEDKDWRVCLYEF